MPILAEMELDEETIIAGLLHDIIEENTKITLEQISIEFSDKIAQLIDHVTQFNKLSWEELKKEEPTLGHHIIFIKLADRLHNMRTIKHIDPKKWNEKAKETIEIFSPIAARLGISKIKAELDDLSLMYL